MYKYYLYSIFILLSFSIINAQNSKIKSIKELISDGNFKRSKEKIIKFKEREKNENSPLGDYCLWLWFIDKNNPAYNPDSGYFYLNIAINVSRNLEIEKTNEICNEINFCPLNFLTYKESTGLLAFDLIKNSGNTDKIENYLLTYKGLKVYDQVVDYRDSLYVENERKNKNTNNLLKFLEKYPNSKYKDVAQHLIYQFEFEKCVTENDFIEYADKYQISNLKKSALLKAEEINFKKAIEINTEQALINHTKKYTNSTYKNDALKIAEALNFSNAIELKNEDLLLAHIQKYPSSRFADSAKNYATELNYQYALKNNLEEIFIEHAKKYPDSRYIDSAKKFALELNYQNAFKKNTEEAFIEHIRIYPGSKYEDAAKKSAEELNYQNAVNIDTEYSYLQHIKNYPNSTRKDKCLIMAENIAFNLLNENSKLDLLKKFIENYPNSLKLPQVNSWIDLHQFDEIVYYLFPKEKNIYTSYMGDVFANFSMKEIFDFYLSRKPVAKFFSNDHYMLMDVLNRMKNSFDNFKNNNYEWEENNITTDNDFSSFGYKFYNRSTSKFCFNLSSSDFERRGSIAILDKNNKLFSIDELTEVERTPVSYVFKLTNNKNKFSLFNSKEGKLITDWVDEIIYSYLSPSFFDENSVENAIVKHYNVESNGLFVGFKINYFKNDDSYKLLKSKIINSKGEEVIDSKIFPNVFPDGTNWESFVPITTCSFLNGQCGSGYMQFKDLNNKIGVCNSTFDSIILPAKFDNIDDIDQFNNIIVRENDIQKIYNITSKKFIELSTFNCYKQIYRFFISDKLNQESIFFNWNDNPNIYYESSIDNGVNYCFGSKDYVYKRKLIYLISSSNYQSNNLCYSQILNYYGKLIYSGKSKLSIESSADDNIIINIDSEKSVLINIEKGLIWEPNKNYLMQFLTQNIIIFGYRDNNNTKHIGVYEIGKGILYEPVFENIRIEEGACYGILLGKETLIWRK